MKIGVLFLWNKKNRQKTDKIRGIMQMKSAVKYRYKLFDNNISKRISTPISETFWCENVTVTYTA